MADPKELSDLLPGDQLAQLGDLLSQVLKSGNGSVEIVVSKGEVKYFNPMISISAAPKDNGATQK